MPKAYTRLRPIQRLAVRLLRQKGFSISQVSYALRIDVNSISRFQSFTNLRNTTLQELGNLNDDTGLFAAAIESANSWLDSLPAVQDLYREGPRGRASSTTTTTPTATPPHPTSRRPVGRSRKAKQAA